MAHSGRENFGSSFTFVMAMAGSAIGLGNIWRFPYMVGEYGGGAFIVAYVLCSLALAIPCFICESIIGRRARSGVVGAFERLAPGTRWRWMGALCVLTCFIIMSFYSVVGGWSLDFLVRSLSGRLAPADPDSAVKLFSGMTASPLESVTMMATFFLASAVIVLGGVKKGIEKFTRISTPLLFILMLAIVIFSISLPGSGGGVEYLVRPDFSKLDAHGWAAALGQAFFSMSLGVGTVLIYSSFMKKSDSIIGSGLWTAGSDTVFALISGFAIMPAVFSAGIAPSAGPSLVYETLPFIFSKMGQEVPVLGYFVTLIFFLTILIAALTSSISMLEVCVEHAVEQYGLKRWQSLLAFLIPGIALGIPCALSFGPMADFKIFGKTVFEFCDFLSSNVFMALGALAFVLFAGWKISREDFRDELTSGGLVKVSAGAFGFLHFVIRWIIPPAIIAIFVSNLFF